MAEVKSAVLFASIGALVGKPLELIATAAIHSLSLDLLAVLLISASVIRPELHRQRMRRMALIELRRQANQILKSLEANYPSGVCDPLAVKATPSGQKTWAV
jgi:hypothetical protein